MMNWALRNKTSAIPDFLNSQNIFPEGPPSSESTAAQCVWAIARLRNSARRLYISKMNMEKLERPTCPVKSVKSSGAGIMNEDQLNL